MAAFWVTQEPFINGARDKAAFIKVVATLEAWADTGKAPKSIIMLHVNDTFGTTQRDATVALAPKFGMPYEILDTIAYDPAAMDLSVEVAKAKSGKWKDAPDYGKAKTGKIALQDHGSVFWFRNVKIRPLQ